jgi:hypothetical protein
VIINEGVVQLGSGIDVNNCQYVKITGSGAKEKYGFRIEKSGGVALTIHGKSAHVEAERFYVEDCAFGCWIKNEADCDTSVNSWVLDDISVHDFEMRNIKIEGLYMGSTDPNNVSRPKDCNGVKYAYKPSKLGNIKIFNGIIDGCGRPAIQLSNAQVGMSEIYNNTISNVGREYSDQQGTGISLGLYTRAYVHHNKIKNTYTWGIASLGGSGLIRIENNKVENSGFLDGKRVNWAQNIVIDTRPTIPADSTKFIILNNQLSNPGKDVGHIEIWRSQDSYAAGNLICGNKAEGKPAAVKVAPGIRWMNCGASAFTAVPTSGISSLLPWIGAGLAFIGIVVFFVLKRKKTGYKPQHRSASMA